MAFRGDNTKQAARDLRQDVKRMASFDEELQNALPQLEQLVETAEKMDKKMDTDLQEEERDITKALKDLKRGRASEEDKQMLEQAMKDLKEMHGLIQELGEDFSKIGNEISKLEREAQKVLNIDEDATQDMELILNQELG